jgi:hypothetical protein
MGSYGRRDLGEKISSAVHSVSPSQEHGDAANAHRVDELLPVPEFSIGMDVFPLTSEVFSLLCALIEGSGKPMDSLRMLDGPARYSETPAVRGAWMDSELGWRAMSTLESLLSASHVHSAAGLAPPSLNRTQSNPGMSFFSEREALYEELGSLLVRHGGAGPATKLEKARQRCDELREWLWNIRNHCSVRLAPLPFRSGDVANRTSAVSLFEDADAKCVYGTSPFMESSEASAATAPANDENRMLLYWERNIIPRVISCVWLHVAHNGTGPKSRSSQSARLRDARLFRAAAPPSSPA